MDDPLGAFLPGPRIRLEGAPQGPLRGLTFAAKDIFDIAGRVTGCGNPDWARTHEPARANAPAVQAWLDAGAALVGKTITDELAYSLNGQNVHYGTPSNSNAPGRIPGGSSCGSAAAVAGGAADLALGSDTGGSIRIPASYCGLFGLRPSHGRIPLTGVMPLATSFDTVGWFARDAALLRRAGAVLLDGVAAEQLPPSGLLLAEDAFALAEPAARGALAPLVERLEAQLGRAERVTIGEPGGGLEQWMLRFRHLQAREIWAEHGAWIERERPRFGPEIQERFDWARSLPPSAAEEAAPQREALTERMAALLRGGRLLCLPTAPGIAPFLSADAENLRLHRSRVLSLTAIAALARLPQVTLPLAQVEGCPLGLSLIAEHGADALLLAFAERFAEVAVARTETWGV
jgi:amidase